jgi:cyclopropane fatty-acyl-phospholipid synthase-like methyltransferase
MDNQQDYITNKELLSLIRSGDYAHAGEEEAIELTMKLLDKNPSRAILDIGCGLGGTAYYLQQHGWGKVCGIDIEENAIAYAKMRYPQLNFIQCDVNKIDTQFSPNQFDLLISFNAFFSFYDQAGALQSLSSVAKPGASLILFDYAHSQSIPENPFPGSSVSHFKPINIDSITELLEKTDWQLTQKIDVTTQFAKWYAEFLKKLDAMKPQAVARFGQNAFDRAYRNFSQAHKMLSDKTLRGVIVYASKK